MKYLKKYNLFLEENEFDVRPTDAPDVGMSKEKLNTLEKQIDDFKVKKISIDKAYLSIIDDEELSNKIKEILGPDISSKLEPSKLWSKNKAEMERNPFLTEYLNVSDLKRRLEKVKKDNVDDKVKLDDFNQELKSSTDAAQKASINQKISDINKRVGLANSTISKLSSDINRSEKDLKTKMDKQEKDLKSYIKSINLKE